MKISSLSIKNFKGIKCAEFNNLGDTVVISGQNGVGKSCILDAIRLLKSSCGGYVQNEFQQWFGEFQLNFQYGINNKNSDIIKIFNDKAKTIELSWVIQLSEHEKEFLESNLTPLLFDYFIKVRAKANGTSFQQSEIEQIRLDIENYLPQAKQELRDNSFKGKLSIEPNSYPETSHITILVQMIFTIFEPQDIGIIDYYGATRIYNREQIGGIQVNFNHQFAQQLQHSSLYNFTSKLSNIKSEMAAYYINNIIAEKLNLPKTAYNNMSETISELFEMFFPNKKFNGPKIDNNGRLTFPVIINNNSEHDLDDLSSGEKEILYGYLRIKNSTPKRSIILFDEPELHLNPKLIANLPAFYKQHLGVEQENQLWIVTHSDAFIKSAVIDDQDVFHLSHQNSSDENQVKKIGVDNEIDMLLLDLIGDSATFSPNNKILVVEGEFSDIDVKILSQLMPDIQSRLNLISGKNKDGIKALYKGLEDISSRANLKNKFFAILDGDNQGATRIANVEQWSVYHIENFLLDAQYIQQALQSQDMGNQLTEDVISEQLKLSAEECIVELVRHMIDNEIHASFVQVLNFKFNHEMELVQGFMERLSECKLKITNNFTKYTQEYIRQRQLELTGRFNEEINNGDWIKTIPGRKILKKFVCNINKHKMANEQLDYKKLRNAICYEMARSNYCPVEITEKINSIINS